MPNLDATFSALADPTRRAILARLPARDQWAVEFGAWDGQLMSNTAALADAGYRRVLIEADQRRLRALRRKYKSDPNTVPILAMVGWSESDSLDTILETTAVPHDFDLLSIDIDGNDYHVWKAVRKYRPKVVVIEFNPTIRNGVEFVQPPDPELNQSSSITSLVGLGRSKGYELAAATEFNAVFVHEDLHPCLGIEDNSVDRLRTDKTWQAEIFFGFDGHAIIQGGRGLHWHGMAVPTDVRLVPRFFDGFPGRWSRPKRGLLRVWTYLRRVRPE